MPLRPRSDTLIVVLAVVLAGAAAAIAGQARAQDCPAGQSCFYVPPAMVSPGGPDPLESELWLSIPAGSATGSYSVDGAAAVAFTVMDTAALRIPLMTAAMSSGVNVAETRGVFIVASRDDLVVEHKQMLFASSVYTEGYSETVPRHSVALGTRFRLGGFRMTGASPLAYASTSQYAMVLAPTGATVTLTAPSGAALPYWTGSTTETLEIVLAAGESATVAARASLDGALLTSTAPVTVSSGGRGWLSPCGDDGADILVPTSQLGTEFAVRLPTGSAAGSDAAVIADVDGTEVRVDGTLVATLAAGQRHSFVPTAVTHVQTSSPAVLWMNGSRGTCELDAVLIPPLLLPTGALSVRFNASFAAEIAVVLDTAQVATLLDNGAAITPASSTLLPGRPDITVVIYTAPAGLHAVQADGGFQLMAAYVGAGAGIVAYFGPFVSCTSDASCPDVGACTFEMCIANACKGTAVMAGMPGDCVAGLVCSGPALMDTCVTCVSDAQCAAPTAHCDVPTATCVEAPDAGPTDAGAADAGTTGDAGMADAGATGDAGTTSDAGARADAGASADASAGADAGTRPATDDSGGCGCAVPGRDHGRGGAALGPLLVLGLLVRRRLGRGGRLGTGR